MSPPLTEAIFEEPSEYRDAMARGEWDKAFAILKDKMGAGGWRALAPREALHLAALHGFRSETTEAVAILSGLSEDPDPAVAVEALSQLANFRLSTQTTSLAEVESLIQSAAAIAGQSRRLLGLVAHTRSRLHWKRYEIKKAGECLEEARKVLEEAGDEEELAKVLDSLAMYYEHRGEREKALSCYSLSLAKKAMLRDLFGIGITLGNLGRFYLRAGEPQIALSCFRDDLRIATKVNDVGAQVVVKINMGQALTETGSLDEAERELEEALFLARRRGSLQQEAYALKDLARVVARKGDEARAFALLSAAIDLLRDQPLTYAKGQVLLTRGNLLLDAKDFEGARAVFQEAQEIFSQLGAKHEEAMAFHGLARISENMKQWNSCIYLVEQGMSCLSTVASPNAHMFEEVLHRMQISSVERHVPHTIGPYRVLALIGRGAYGDVYKGFDERQGASRDDVAIKVLHLEGVSNKEDRSERTSRFQRECQILSQVHHPNIVRYIDSGTDVSPYMVQEYIGGGDLMVVFKDPQSVTMEKFLSIAKGILSGLSALHAQGIVHRDLKPGNILLRDTGEPVIADFGLARMVGLTALTLTSMVMGTLGYMAPEQLRGDAADERSDIFAIGVILFQLGAGRLPYEQNTLRGVLRSIEHDPPPDLARFRPDLPPRIIRCVGRCLEKEPSKRYSGAPALLEEIDAGADGRK